MPLYRSKYACLYHCPSLCSYAATDMKILIYLSIYLSIYLYIYIHIHIHIYMYTPLPFVALVCCHTFSSWICVPLYCKYACLCIVVNMRAFIYTFSSWICVPLYSKFACLCIVVLYIYYHTKERIFTTIQKHAYLLLYKGTHICVACCDAFS